MNFIVSYRYFIKDAPTHTDTVSAKDWNDAAAKVRLECGAVAIEGIQKAD